MSTPTTPTTKPQLHISMINMMDKCWIQFVRRFGARFGIWDNEEIIAPGVAQTTGTAVHAAIEQNLKAKIATGKLLELDDVAYRAVERVKQQWFEGMMLTEDEAVSPDKTLNDMINTSVGLINLHSTLVAPTIHPAAVEEPWVVEMPNYPYDLAGKIDCREEDTTLIDHKTVDKTPGPNAADTPQSNLYALNRKVVTGFFPKAIRLDHMVKNKTPKYEPRIYVPNETGVRRVLARIGRAIELIELAKLHGPNIGTPAPADSWVCSKKFCGYAAKCPFWSGK